MTSDTVTTHDALELIRHLLYALLVLLVIVIFLGSTFSWSYFRLVHRVDNQDKVIATQDRTLKNNADSEVQRTTTVNLLKEFAVTFAVLVDPKATAVEHDRALDHLRALGSAPVAGAVTGRIGGYCVTTDALTAKGLGMRPDATCPTVR